MWTTPRVITGTYRNEFAESTKEVTGSEASS